MLDGAPVTRKQKQEAERIDRFLSSGSSSAFDASALLRERDRHIEEVKAQKKIASAYRSRYVQLQADRQKEMLVGWIQSRPYPPPPGSIDTYVSGLIQLKNALSYPGISTLPIDIDASTIDLAPIEQRVSCIEATHGIAVQIRWQDGYVLRKATEGLSRIYTIELPTYKMWDLTSELTSANEDSERAADHDRVFLFEALVKALQCNATFFDDTQPATPLAAFAGEDAADDALSDARTRFFSKMASLELSDDADTRENAIHQLQAHQSPFGINTEMSQLLNSHDVEQLADRDTAAIAAQTQSSLPSFDALKWNLASTDGTPMDLGSTLGNAFLRQVYDAVVAAGALLVRTEAEARNFEDSLSDTGRSVKREEKRADQTPKGPIAWHQTKYTTDCLISRDGFEQHATPTITCIFHEATSDCDGWYEVTHLFVPSGSLDSSVLEDARVALIAAANARFEFATDEAGRPFSKRKTPRNVSGEYFVQERGGKAMEGFMFMYGSHARFASGKDEIEKVPGCAVEWPARYNEGRSARSDAAIEQAIDDLSSAFTVVESTLMPEAAHYRRLLADDYDPEANFRVIKGEPNSTGFSISLTAGYVVMAHDDSGLALELIGFVYPYGTPLPDGHAWEFAVAGCIHPLPKTPDEFVLVAVRGKGVAHGTLPTSSTQPHCASHPGIGSALVSKKDMIRVLDKMRQPNALPAPTQAQIDARRDEVDLAKRKAVLTSNNTAEREAEQPAADTIMAEADKASASSNTTDGPRVIGSSHGRLLVDGLRSESTLPSSSDLDGVSPKYVEEVKALMKEPESVGFDDIRGLGDHRETLKDIVDALRHPEDGSTPCGLLLEGPPGTGKTMVAKAIANESQARLFVVPFDFLTSGVPAQQCGRISALFAVAHASSPSILFIDECDGVMQARNAGQRIAHLKSTWQMDSNISILLIGCTNHADKIESGLRSRFSDTITFSLPDLEARQQIARREMDRIQLRSALDAADWVKLAEATEGLSGRDITGLIQSLMRTLKRQYRGDANGPPPLTLAGFLSKLPQKTTSAASSSTNISALGGGSVNAANQTQPALPSEDWKQTMLDNIAAGKLPIFSVDEAPGIVQSFLKEFAQSRHSECNLVAFTPELDKALGVPSDCHGEAMRLLRELMRASPDEIKIREGVPLKRNGTKYAWAVLSQVGWSTLLDTARASTPRALNSAIRKRGQKTTIDAAIQREMDEAGLHSCHTCTMPVLDTKDTQFMEKKAAIERIATRGVKLNPCECGAHVGGV